MERYIRFDWAMKRLLRDKANYVVLEGLLTTLLGKKITIQKLLESESNQDTEESKQNRVDLLAEDEHGVLYLMEVQNETEFAYFQRMLFGASKLVTEYINRGQGYENIRKVYSIDTQYYLQHDLSLTHLAKHIGTNISLETLSNGNSQLTFTMPDDIVTLQPVFAKGENVVDGISIVNADGTKSTVIYDLNGRRVIAPSRSGIYIRNGKKVVIK